eukprot:3500901-Amphidinium_carterae.1
MTNETNRGMSRLFAGCHVSRLLPSNGLRALGHPALLQGSRGSASKVPGICIPSDGGALVQRKLQLTRGQAG